MLVNNLIVLSNPNLPGSVEASQRRIIFTPEYVYKSREALLSSVVKDEARSKERESIVKSAVEIPPKLKIIPVEFALSSVSTTTLIKDS